ncbi:MAG: hypothetical protein V1701_02675 [Planctomycetota bacterium]
MAEWSNVPECFGERNEDNLTCGKCESLHDCLFLRSIKSTERLMEKGVHPQPATVPMQVQIMPEDETIRHQAECYWKMWNCRVNYLFTDEYLKKMMGNIMGQGFSKEEAFAIMIKLI